MNSLCIPRAMSYTTSAEVEKVFNVLFAGHFVERVDERTVTDSRGQEFKMFYIHFGDETNEEMEQFNQKMEEDGVVQVMTGRGKWFWKVYVNKSTKTEKPVRKGPRIMTEEDEKLFLQWKESRNPVAPTAFTQEELDTLDQETGQGGFTEEELDELDAEHTLANSDEDELMAVADEMAKE